MQFQTDNFYCSRTKRFMFKNDKSWVADMSQSRHRGHEPGYERDKIITVSNWKKKGSSKLHLLFQKGQNDVTITKRLWYGLIAFSVQMMTPLKQSLSGTAVADLLAHCKSNDRAQGERNVKGHPVFSPCTSMT